MDEKGSEERIAALEDAVLRMDKVLVALLDRQARRDEVRQDLERIEGLFRSISDQIGYVEDELRGVYDEDADECSGGVLGRLKAIEELVRNVPSKTRDAIGGRR